MEWDILNNFTIYAPMLPMEMEIDEIFFTLRAKKKKMLLLFCTWKENLQTGCQEILHSLFFWVKASM